MKYRIALALLGVSLWFGYTARAETILISNLFAGTNTGAASVSVSGGLTGGQSDTDVVGPGYTATVNVGLGLANSLSVAVNSGNNGYLTVTEANLLGVAESFSATKTFTDTGTVLQADTTYRIDLTGLSSATLSALGSLDIQVSQGGTALADTSSGLGLLGVVDVLSLFGGGTTASLQFTTPAALDTSVPVTISFLGSFPVSVGTNTFTLTGASLSQVDPVPEPSVWAMLLLAALAAGGAVRRRGAPGRAS